MEKKYSYYYLITVGNFLVAYTVSYMFLLIVVVFFCI